MSWNFMDWYHPTSNKVISSIEWKPPGTAMDSNAPSPGPRPTRAGPPGPVARDLTTSWHTGHRPGKFRNSRAISVLHINSFFKKMNIILCMYVSIGIYIYKNWISIYIYMNIIQLDLGVPYLALRGVHGCSKLLEPPMVLRDVHPRRKRLPTISQPQKRKEKTSWNESANKIKLHLIIYTVIYIVYKWGPQTVVFTSTACCSWKIPGVSLSKLQAIF